MKLNLIWTGVTLLALLGSANGTLASQYTALHLFSQLTSGVTPRGTLHLDGQGNFYGTTLWGGNSYENIGCGVVFKLDPSGTETVLHTFQDQDDGCFPYSGVIEDASGNLYGTTSGDGHTSFGNVFRLDESGALATLHTFCSQPDCRDGWGPIGGLVRDANGNLFGTTELGGANTYGTIFKIAADGTFTTLYSFRNGNDGGNPLSDIIADGAGNLYGTASQGGDHGAGTVFKFTKKGRLKVLHAFNGGESDGAFPEFGLVRDRKGNLYGTTSMGGLNNCDYTFNVVGCGIVFKIVHDKTETVLHRFGGGSEGGWPSGLVLDANGNLFGGSGHDPNGQGVIFELLSGSRFKILHSLNCATDGCRPYNSLIEDNAGKLYGTMTTGGSDYCNNGVALCGTVFELSP